MSDRYNLPAITLRATSKNNYDYTLHIHILNEDHLSEEFNRFWGDIMLEGIMKAKKYDPTKPTYHVIYIDHEWIDNNKEYKTEFQFTNPGTSRYLTSRRNVK